MSRLGDKSKLLEVLAETPIVSFACKKVGIDRRTFYRWYKDDKDLREQADKVLIIGRRRINDMAESVILKKINEEDLRATIFWLQHNEPRYRPVKTDWINPIDNLQSSTPGKIDHREPLRVEIVDASDPDDKEDEDDGPVLLNEEPG